jgi:hypothetical protein
MLRTPPILNLPELRIASGARLALDLAQVVSESTSGVRISNSRDPKSRVSRAKGKRCVRGADRDPPHGYRRERARVYWIT